MLLWRHFACSCFLVGREVNSDKYTNEFCYYFLLVWFAIKFVIVPVHLIDANMMLCKLALGFFSV